MKSSKIFIALGALTLSVVGFVTTKANKKFAGVSKAFMTPVNASAGSTISNLSTAHYTNSVITGQTVILVTATGHTLLATVVSFTNRANKVYYH